MLSNKKTLCIILHYGSEEDTWKCVRSIISEPNTDIVVSDNDPLQHLAVPSQFMGIVKIYKTGGASGFAEGNNLAVNFFLTEEHDSVLILNNDTLVQAGAIGILQKTIHESNIGAVGPCMPFAQNPGKIWACGGWINKVTLKIGGLKNRQKSTVDVDYLPGAAILCRAEIWQRLNGLPEKYIFGYEEAEFAMRIRKLGYRVVANPKAIILHYVGMSSQPKPMYYYNLARNKLRFAKYIYGVFVGTFIGLLITVVRVIASSLHTIKLRLILSWWAVRDEMTNIPLTKQKLLDVARKTNSI